MEIISLKDNEAEQSYDASTEYDNFDSGKIQDMIAQMHEYENRADAKKHEMTAELARAFVTPLDREDLAEISGKIDDVADMVDDLVLGSFLMTAAHITLGVMGQQ